MVKYTKIKYFLSCILILALFMISAPTRAASSDFPEVRVAVEQGVAEARTLLEKGQGERAWELLTRLMFEDPENVDINLLWVQAASKTGRANQALAALERLVIMHPKDANMRLELARAYASMGDRASAQAEMEIVKNMDPSLAGADADLELERAATKGSSRRDRFQLAGRLAVGLVWDSNVNNGLADLDVSVGDMKLTMNSGAKKKAALGQYANVNLNGGWRLGKDSPWWLVGDVNFHGKNYYPKVPSNQHFAWGRVAFGLRYVSAKHLFDLRVHQEHARYEPKEYSNSTGLDGTWIYALLPKMQIVTRAGVDFRTYTENDKRNGNYWYAGTYLRWLWGRKNTNSVMAGVRALGAGAREDQYSYAGWEGMVRLNLSPIERLDIAPFVGYREQYYRAPATKLSAAKGEGKRKDQTWMTGVFFTWHWTKHVATEVGWQYNKNYSNSKFYQYDQHQINMGMVFTF